MPIAKLYDFPVRRPTFVNTAQWNGPDDDLSLIVGYFDENGMQRSTSLTTTNTSNGIGDICLPSRADIEDIPRDTLVAHLRMATFISKTVAGSAEWKSAFVEQEGSQDFQLAIGTAAVIDIRIVDDIHFDVDIKRKSQQTVKTIRSDHAEMSNYTFTPSTQLKILGGALKFEFPNFVHDHPSEVLSSQQRQQIIDHILTLQPWV